VFFENNVKLMLSVVAVWVWMAPLKEL